MKIKLAVGLIAAIGLSAFSAKAQETVDYSAAVNFKLTGLVQGADVESSKGDTTTTKYVVKKVKITNKEILAVLQTNALLELTPVTFPKGAKLVGDDAGSEGSGFAVVVADKTGTNILYRPDFSLFLDELEISSGKSSETSTDTSSKSSDSGTGTSIGTAQLAFGEGEGFDVSGLIVYAFKNSSTESDTKATSSDKTSFKANVAGKGSSSEAGGDMIVSGSISGGMSHKTSETF